MLIALFQDEADKHLRQCVSENAEYERMKTEWNLQQTQLSQEIEDAAKQIVCVVVLIGERSCQC